MPAAPPPLLAPATVAAPAPAAFFGAGFWGEVLRRFGGEAGSAAAAGGGDSALRLRETAALGAGLARVGRGCKRTKSARTRLDKWQTDAGGSAESPAESSSLPPPSSLPDDSDISSLEASCRLFTAAARASALPVQSAIPTCDFQRNRDVTSAPAAAASPGLSAAAASVSLSRLCLQQRLQRKRSRGGFVAQLPIL